MIDCLLIIFIDTQLSSIFIFGNAVVTGNIMVPTKGHIHLIFRQIKILEIIKAIIKF